MECLARFENWSLILALTLAWPMDFGSWTRDCLPFGPPGGREPSHGVVKALNHSCSVWIQWMTWDPNKWAGVANGMRQSFTVMCSSIVFVICMSTLIMDSLSTTIHPNNNGDMNSITCLLSCREKAQTSWIISLLMDAMLLKVGWFHSLQQVCYTKLGVEYLQWFFSPLFSSLSSRRMWERIIGTSGIQVSYP